MNKFLLFILLFIHSFSNVFAQGTNDFVSKGLPLTKNVMVIDLEKGLYEVTEIFNFMNKSNSVLKSEKNTSTFKFVLPISSNVRNPNAVWSSAPVGLDPKFYEISKTTLVSREPFPKGDKFILLRYRLADSYGGIKVTKPVFFDSPNFTLLTNRKNVQLDIDGTIVSNILKLNGKEYNQYLIPLRSGSNFSLNLKAPDSLGRLDFFYVLFAVLFIASFTFAFLYRRKRAIKLKLIHEREQLLRKIASLDDLMDSGQIQEDTYKEERGLYFSRLLEIQTERKRFVRDS